MPPFALALMLAATACSSGPDPIERARLAAGRAPTSTLPEAPGQNQPFPNLGSVPARPETIAPEARRRLEDALVADRANARYVGQPVVPTVPPTSVSAPPRPEDAPLAASGAMLMGADEAAPRPLGAPEAPPIAGTPAPPSPSPPPAMTQPAPAPPAVTMEALPPPPAPAMPEELSPPARQRAEQLAAPSLPEPAAIPPVPAAPIVPQPVAAAPPATAPVLLPRATRETPGGAAAIPVPTELAPASASPASASPAPATPAPASPAPRQAAAPAPPPPPVPPQPAVVIDRTALLRTGQSTTGQAYALAFLPGTQDLVTRDRAVLASLATRGQGAIFRVTGFGDHASAGHTLDLPLARARVVGDALRAAGVPAEAIELGGSATPGPAGRGAEVRLVYSR